MVDTYLQECLKNGLTVRWPDASMPLKFYIAPFRWYENDKQGQAGIYHQMVLNAFRVWNEASHGKIKFQQVPKLLDSQINVAWRRVDRKRLGHCEYHVNDKSLLFSAEVSIGISDGKVHAQYDDPREVQETITHEVGHALGLIGHSTVDTDIMYPNRLYGQYEGVSERDIETLKWLYQLPVGFDYQATGKHYGLKTPFTLNDVLDIISGKGPEKPFQQRLEGKIQQTHTPESPHVIEQQHDILTQRGKFWMMTQHINPTPDVQHMVILDQLEREKRRRQQPPPP